MDLSDAPIPARFARALSSELVVNFSHSFSHMASHRLRRGRARLGYAMGGAGLEPATPCL